MKLRIFRTLWGAGNDYLAIAAEAQRAGFDGLEGGLPEPARRAEFITALTDNHLRYIGEICTGGYTTAWWIPRRRASIEEHLQSLEVGLQSYVDCGFPVDFINCMGGLDAWPIVRSVDFFARAMTLGDKYGIKLSFETHRSRSMFSPWATLEIIQALPEILITCDFSHWCVVTERLIDEEQEALAAVAARAHHIQSRVGYEQGPQVPDPSAPEYRYALNAHQRWWAQVWAAQRARGYASTTMTPEFGPDGYLQTQPFTGTPVADLWQVNRWMAETERAHFRGWLGTQ